MPEQHERGSGGPAAFRYAGLGVQLAATILLGVLAGRWADQKLGTDGILTAAGALLGFGATLYSLVMSLKRDGQK
ncbi:MAG TPA: AtpZ/AtpI family protein [Gemmatimonadales bacterium]